MRASYPVFAFLALIMMCPSLSSAENQDDIRKHYESGIQNHRLGRLNAAMKDYKFLEERGAADYKVFNNMGVILAAKKKYPEAEEYFKKALEKEPGQPDAENNLIKLYADTKNYRAAIEEYKKTRKNRIKK
jgi:tetratricopeptide (TPR) repeat protein